MKRLFRYIPAVHTLQKEPRFKEIEEKYSLSSSMLTSWLQDVIEAIRIEVKEERLPFDLREEEPLRDYIFHKLEERVRYFITDYELKPVINATGVVIHTNLGRSRLSDQAVSHLVETARSYSTLEYNVEEGVRGSRHDLVEEYLTELTGAESAMVVNNNAAAVYFILHAFAKGKEVIVSRGELVEIGGSFRISEIMALSEAELKEVGTTNRTRLRDYEEAISENTGMLLKVHKSNFSLIGFTEEVRAEDLVSLAHSHNLLLYEDLGSGTLFDFSEKGIGVEPTVQGQLKKGIDLLSFSGDKLLGGPQAGIIVGKKRYIDQLKAHQLARVLRVDKFTLASLEATLKSYLQKRAEEEVPTVRDILKSKEDILKLANRFVEALQGFGAFEMEVREAMSKVGGGTMPEVELPSYVVEVIHRDLSSEAMAKALRQQERPIIVRLKDGKLLLDFRTVDEEEVVTMIEGFKKLH